MRRIITRVAAASASNEGSSGALCHRRTLSPVCVRCVKTLGVSLFVALSVSTTGSVDCRRGGARERRGDESAASHA